MHDRSSRKQEVVMILVVGATGDVGGVITRRLLEDGHAVRILVRQGSDHAALAEAGAEPVLGDLKDPPSLDAACAGIETVVTTANSAKRGGEDTVETVDLHGNRALVEAATQAGAKRFVFISALGADPESPVPFLQAKALTEQSIQASGMSYAILRPDPFMDIWVPVVVGIALQTGQPVRLVGQGDHRHSFVFSGDVAQLAAALADRVEPENRVIPVGGPEALSWSEIVDRVERITGGHIPVEYVAPGAEMPGMPPFVSGLLSAQETYESPIDMTDTSRQYGVTLTSLDAFASRLFAPPASTG
jgi:NADH dehydrogenase